MILRTFPVCMLGLALVCAEVRLHGQEMAIPTPARWSSMQPSDVVIRGQSPEVEVEVEGGDEEDELETDRDSFTPATTTAGTNRLILETAYSFLDNRHTFETHSFPEMVARYGVNDWLEFRLGWNYEIGGEGNTASGTGLGGSFQRETAELVEEHNISYGAKIAVTRQDNWIPASALIVQAFTPTGGPSSDTQLVDSTYVGGWELANGWFLDSAIRYGTESEEEDHGSLWAPSIVLKVPIGERWKAHAEYFGIFSTGLEDNRSPQYFSPGIHYLVTPDLEVGVRLGWGLSDDAAKFFSNVGLGVRF